MATGSENDPVRKHLANERPIGESRIERDGLEAGTTAPTFALPDIGGGFVSLEEYRGRRVLVVFSDPACGPSFAGRGSVTGLHRTLRADPPVGVIGVDTTLDRHERRRPRVESQASPSMTVS